MKKDTLIWLRELRGLSMADWFKQLNFKMDHGYMENDCTKISTSKLIEIVDVLGVEIIKLHQKVSSLA